MRKLITAAATGAVILATNPAMADGLNENVQQAPAAQTDRWGSEVAKSSSINAGYIVLGILLAFVAVNAINDGAAE